MKSTVVSLFCFVVGLSAMTAHAETIGVALKQCSEESNSLQRLVCYDNVVKSINQYSGLDTSVQPRETVQPSVAAAPSATSKSQTAVTLPATVPPTTNTQNSPVLSPEQEFGLEAKTPAEEIDKIYSVVAKVEKGRYDRYVITLENGGVWRQTGNDRLKVKVGQRIYIERGVLNAFYLSRDDLNRRMKVKRVE